MYCKLLKGPYWSHIYFKGSYHKAFIRSGSATDHDYAADDRTQVTYSAFLKSNEGHTLRYAVALAYVLRLHEMLDVIPYAGYANNSQSLSLKNFEEEKGGRELNSTYQSKWNGPAVGLDLELARTRRINLNAGFSYQQLNYTGRADWNLIDAFNHPLSFKHIAKGFETQVLLRLNFSINSRCSVYLRGEHRYAETGSGIDQLFLADSRERESQFNGAVRKVNAIGAGVVFSLK